MNCSNKSNRKKHPLLWWAGQLIIMFAAALLTAASYPLGGVIHGVLLWGLYPLLGAFSACICTVKGLLNHVSWILPPVVLLPANHLIWGYLIDPGPVFLCAFICIVGAATGEVIRKRNEKSHSRHQHRKEH